MAQAPVPTTLLARAGAGKPVTRGVRSATEALEFALRPIDRLLRSLTGHHARHHPRDHGLGPELHPNVWRRARADDVVLGIMVGAHRIVVDRALRRLDFGPHRQIRHRQKWWDVIARRRNAEL